MAANSAFDDTDVILLGIGELPTNQPKTVTRLGGNHARWLPRSCSSWASIRQALDAVRMEGTTVLPGLFDSDHN